MGNRWGRKKTRKVKMQQKLSSRGVERRGDLNEIASALPRNDKEGNGHLWCNHSEGYISFDVCIIRQTRTPGNCKGCGHFKEVA